MPVKIKSNAIDVLAWFIHMGIQVSVVKKCDA